jgi:hypothetical protein
MCAAYLGSFFIYNFGGHRNKDQANNKTEALSFCAKQGREFAAQTGQSIPTSQKGWLKL